MKIDNEKFKCPSTAREYIRSMALAFEDPWDMLEFIGACDIAQAALTCWLLEEYRCSSMLHASHKHNNSLLDNQIEIKGAWDAYSQATSEFQQAKLKLKDIVSKLDKTDDKMLSGSMCHQ